MTTKEDVDEEELIELARETADRLKMLTVKLEAYAGIPHDSGDRRRFTDREEND